MDVRGSEVLDVQELIDKLLDQLDQLDDLPQPRFELKYQERDPGYRPSVDEDPYNVFIRKCLVKGAATGKLAGKRIGVKDAIFVAGVPLTHGSRVLVGYTPDVDAVVIERLLDAGASIVGKLNQDDFANGGTSETSAFGYVRNPLNPEYSPGGSSSGSGAAVASGDVDIALGVDQRGSGRIPAAWCGVASIKPTHGRVPTFGIVYMDHSLDYVCPIAKTVQEVALTLEVIAGPDRRDPQVSQGSPGLERRPEGVDRPLSSLRIGLLEEAFEWPASEPDVSRLVRDAVGRLGELGIAVEEVSIPLLRHADAIWSGVVTHGMTALFQSDAEGYWRGGYYNVEWQEAFGKFRRARADDLQLFTKTRLVLGKYLQSKYMSTYYSKAQNLRMLLREQVDEALGRVDVLAMPTTPQKPLKLSDDTDLKRVVGRARDLTSNTSAFDLTGHPALTVPCGFSEGLPVGLQLVSRHWDEALLFSVGQAVEQTRG
jgi:amidase